MKKLQQLIAYYKNVDPCGEKSTCLVKAACQLKVSTPWLRTKKCPDYIIYFNRRDNRLQLKNNIDDWFWYFIILGGFVTVVATFIMGIVKWIEMLFY